MIVHGVRPLVSVVTPAYNCAPTIEGTIASVQAQTEGDFEHLVVDDCSTDDTVQRVERLAAGDARIRLLRHARNSGRPFAGRNTALDEARGRYLAFLDSDDGWEADKLATQIRVLRGGDAVLCYTAYHRIDEGGKPITGTIHVPPRLDYQGLLRQTAITTSTVLVDSERSGPFRMPMVFYDDYACWLALLRSGRVASGVNADLAWYRVRDGSWSRNKLRSAWEVWRTYRDVEHIGLLRSAWCIGSYSYYAIRKYV